MNQHEVETIQNEADLIMRAHPESRVLSFTWQGERYWIKKKQSNHRKAFAKYSVEKEFYYEVAHITVAARAVDSAPEIVALTDRYMVLRDSGSNVKDWLTSGIGEKEKCHILQKAGEALARLHEAGLYHGRPALRDTTWNGKRIVFLDWENKTLYRDLPHRQIMDVILFFQGMYREPWMNGRYAEAAWTGYESAGGREVLDAACRFIRHHRLVYDICRMLHPFHFKDVEAVERLCRWMVKKSRLENEELRMAEHAE